MCFGESTYVLQTRLFGLVVFLLCCSFSLDVFMYYDFIVPLMHVYRAAIEKLLIISNLVGFTDCTSRRY